MLACASDIIISYPLRPIVEGSASSHFRIIDTPINADGFNLANASNPLPPVKIAMNIFFYRDTKNAGPYFSRSSLNTVVQIFGTIPTRNRRRERRPRF